MVALCVGWLWLRGGDVRVIQHVAHMQMMHAYTDGTDEYAISGDQWPWNMIMMEMDLAFANLEHEMELGPFVGVATRGSEARRATDSGEGGLITKKQMKLLSSLPMMPYDVFYQSSDAKRDVNYNNYYGLRVMNLNGRVISRSRCNRKYEVRKSN